MSAAEQPMSAGRQPVSALTAAAGAPLFQPMRERVLVAMSGGVDSSVAAARLVAAGHDVVGVTLHLWDYPDDGSVAGRCCAPEDIHDARRVADALKIPHFAFDRRELFAKEVVAPFVDGYLAGETPSPCVRCNRGVKLAELLALTERLDAAAVATGHYARRVEVDGRLELHRARDRSKDQSYFLHTVTPAALARLRFPLGDATKAEVRAEAVALGLPGANKGESQELCFVPTGHYTAFVEERGAGRLRPGPIVDDGGRVVGQHDGIHRFTVGQRKALGVALGVRSYVVDVDAEDGTVRLGAREALERRSCELTELVLAEDVTTPLDCEASVRYRGAPVRAQLVRTATGATLRFAEPPGAVVAGQYAVFYLGERVVGGALIARSSAEPAEREPDVVREPAAVVDAGGAL